MVLALLACRGEGSTVESESDAPFPLDRVRATLWGVGPENDAEEGAALLLLSDSEKSCSDMSSAPLGDDVDFDSLFGFIDQGSGLMFMLKYEDYASGDSEPASASDANYEGLWTGLMYRSSADSQMSRNLYALGFSDGFVFLIDGYYGYLGSDTWLRVDELSGSTVSGTYHTVWWKGDFEAEYCGAWEADGEDDWWDTW